MPVRKRLVSLLLCLLLTGGVSCSAETAETALTPMNREAIFSKRDSQWAWNENEVTEITLQNESITLSEAGVYRLSGIIENGQIRVDAKKDAKIQLILNGLSVHSQTHAALYIKQADKVFITLAPGTENILSGGEEFLQTDENHVDAVLFSKDDITLNGEGALTVNAPGSHGIVGKDEVTITGGSYRIQSSGHGITGQDGIAIKDGRFTLETGKDGLHADHDTDESLGFVLIDGGQLDITCGLDGISASGPMEIAGGSFSLLCGGGYEQAEKKQNGFGMPPAGFGGGRGNPRGGFGPGASPLTEPDTESASASTESKKGIKAKGSLLIEGGTFLIRSADDALHTNASMEINGGTFTLETGDDGLHADETLTWNQGEMNITNSYEGLEGLHILIHGGRIALTSDDDGLNAAGGTDESGFGGRHGGKDRFGGPGFGPMSKGNGSILITGGFLTITARGDGIDANGSFQMDGGHMILCGPAQGDTTPLDYDTTAEINGGIFIATGGRSMAQSFSGGTQGKIAVQVGNASAGTEIILTDAGGKQVLSHTPALDFSIALFSTPDLCIGERYTLQIGTAAGTFAAE